MKKSFSHVCSLLRICRFFHIVSHIRHSFARVISTEYQDLHIHSQRYYRGYIPRLLRLFFTCASLPSIERNDVKKEQVPRFVLINWSTCAGSHRRPWARSFQRAALDIGRTNIGSRFYGLGRTGNKNIFCRWVPELISFFSKKCYFNMNLSLMKI